MKIISKTTPPPSISKTPDETVLYTYSKRQWPFQTRPTAIYTKGLYQSKSIHPHPALINIGCLPYTKAGKTVARLFKRIQN